MPNDPRITILHNKVASYGKENQDDDDVVTFARKQVRKKFFGASAQRKAVCRFWRADGHASKWWAT